MKITRMNYTESVIRKADMMNVRGGEKDTSTSVMKECGLMENEYPDDGFGKPDYSYDPILVEYPDKPSKKITFSHF